ncbi:MAG TPA: cell wall hydrolase [Sphingomonas sp.]
MGRELTELGQVALLACALAAVNSCVPLQEREADRVAQAIADARPLLSRLDLDVPDLSAEDWTLPAATPSLGGSLAPPPFELAARSAGDADRALECLTEAVYHEARSQGEDGQRAVAQVVLNRVRDRAFPASVCGVVYQGSHRRTGCQFSFTCDGSLARRREPGAWERAEAVAQAALSGQVYAPVGSATHYHADYVSPWWAPSLARIGAVGDHVFYRWRGALERALSFRQSYAGAEPGVGRSAGVTVARAAPAALSEERGGVTVHRGVASPLAPRPVVVSAGVRVHRNLDPGEEAAEWSGAYTIDGAAIGAEADPS